MQIKIDGKLKRANYSFTALALNQGRGECDAFDDAGNLAGKIVLTRDGIRETRMLNGKVFQYFDGEKWEQK